MEIEVRKPTEAEIEEAKSWPVWEKEESEFDWEYSSEEKFLVISGKAEVVAEDGSKTEFEEGDLVIMPKGFKCRWKVKEKIVKHYSI